MSSSLTGYRASYNGAQAIKSIFKWHNESINIWIHIMGFALFFYLMKITRTLLPPNAELNDSLIFSLFCGSAMLCLFCSSLFHVMSCHDQKQVYDALACLDYAAITSLICGSFSTLVYYGFYCHPFWRNLYLYILCGISFVGLILPFTSGFREAKSRLYRTLVFVILGLSCIVPLLHITWLAGLPIGCWMHLVPVLFEGFFYLAGAYIYAMRLPEKYFPGKFDLIFHSHQLWHLFIVIGAYMHYQASLHFVHARLSKGCLYGT